MDYIEIAVAVSPKEQGCELLIAEMSDIGYESFVETESGFASYIQQNNYSEELLKELFKSYAKLLQISYQKKIIEKQNWNKTWEENFEPIDIEGLCYVRAPFHESKKNYKYELIIEPKMSFGTGHHYTTQLMIKELMTLNVKNKSLLDMGCGTGVLAILASKMEANPILAIDIDDWSVENSLENIKRNNTSNISVKKGDVKSIFGQTFFTILANINKNVLLNDIPQYALSLEVKGSLIMSGFFESDMSELIKTSNKYNLQLKNSLTNEGWALLHFIKNE